MTRLLSTIALTLLIGIALWGLPRAAGEEPSFTQVRLTAEMLDRYRRVGEAMTEVEFRSARGSFSGDPDDDPELYAEFTRLARKSGFASAEAAIAVARTVQLVMMGLDPATGAFEEPAVRLRRELERVRNDPALAVEAREAMAAELEALIPTVPKLEIPENVAVVRTFLEAMIEP